MYNVSVGFAIFNNNNYIYGKLISMIYNNSTLNNGKVSKIILSQYKQNRCQLTVKIFYILYYGNYYRNDLFFIQS